MLDHLITFSVHIHVKGPMQEKTQGVFKRGRKWWIRVPTGEPGKYRRESIGTYDQAVAAYEERILRRTVGPSLHAVMWRYLALRPKVNKSYISHARFFDRLFPDVQLQDFLQIDRLRAWQKERLETRSRATVNHEMAFLSAVVQQAIEDGLIEENPIGGRGKGRLPYLSVDNGRTRWLREAEESSVREVLPDDTWEAVLFAINTGMRRGEQWALEWSDWREDTIFIKAAKTKRGRTCFLNETALGILKARKTRGLARPFPATSAQAMAKAFNRAMKKIEGMEDLTWHGLRHTTPTRLIRAGANLRAIQRAMGWQSLAMVERYTHVEDDQIRAMMKLLKTSQ